MEKMDHFWPRIITLTSLKICSLAFSEIILDGGGLKKLVKVSILERLLNLSVNLFIRYLKSYLITVWIFIKNSYYV